MADQADLARTGDLDDRRVVSYLDTLDLPELIALLMPPSIVTRIHVTPGGGSWKPGESRPSLADEDPAVMAAIARCATARWRTDERFPIAATASHPERCGWCDYPAGELLRALDWANHYARFIEAEAHVWRRGHAIYRRESGRAGTYENPRWANFAALPAKEQRYLTDRAAEDSKANLVMDPAPVVAPPAPREHLPWCDMRPDHPDDCPPMPEDTEDAT